MNSIFGKKRSREWRTNFISMDRAGWSFSIKMDRRTIMIHRGCFPAAGRSSREIEFAELLRVFVILISKSKTRPSRI